MKRMVLPVIGALFCLQFMAGCLETKQGGSNVRVMNGRSNAAKAKKAKIAAQEAAIKEMAFNFKDDDGYRIYIDPILANMTAQDKEALGLVNLIKARSWKTMSLANKSVPNEVYYALKAGEAAPDRWLTWVSPSYVYIDQPAYEAYLTEDNAKILLNVMMTTLRLETKGLLKGFESSAAEDETEKGEVVVGEGKNDTKGIVTAMKNRKPLPRNVCENNPELAGAPECRGVKADTVEAKRSKLLTDQDKKNISEAVKYLMESGRSAKISDIKAKLQSLEIIK
ncbi:hypothetical protein B9G69_016450 [Bdellovibrio sp. SKB1291214]|uniref:hypothetical protein n=1 Tax=Bdellovibrio sp. SKB1291214 TaxID=1732569 RepID=UPI000B517E22|nr:hypothetical protein [Bdellovibrio sp. SKB1291214]UYL08635.1 hypothetical protein B9G69_016450 [Bdellovibrio sp. SKB1291214]